MVLAQVSHEVTVRYGLGLQSSTWVQRFCFQSGSLNIPGKSLVVCRRPRFLPMCPHDVAAALPRVSDLRESKAEAVMSFMTWSQQSHSVIVHSAPLVTQISPFQCGRRLPQGMHTRRADPLGAILEVGCH